MIEQLFSWKIFSIGAFQKDVEAHSQFIYLRRQDPIFLLP